MSHVYLHAKRGAYEVIDSSHLTAVEVNGYQQ